MTHEEYWKSRIDNVFDSNYHKNELKKMYIKAYAENEKQILKLYDELKKKGKLTTTQLYRTDRFMSLRKALAKQAEQVNSELNERMTQDLTNAYQETFGECVRELGLDMTWSMQNEKMLNKVLNTKWAGSNYSKRIWNNSQQLPKDVEAAVVDCLTRGTSKDVYVKAIKNKYNVGFSKADRLVRTELSHTINEGQRDIYKSYGFKKVKWYAAEDERMCKLCGSMHEKIYDIDDVPSVAHANCRCTFSPVAESLETGGKSAKTVDNSAKSDIIKVDRVMTGHSGAPKKAEPNSIIDHKTNGKTDVRAFYSEKGLKIKDINTNSHGNPKRHPYGKNGEHAHDYEWDNKNRLKNRTTRELTEKERKENADIL